MFFLVAGWMFGFLGLPGWIGAFGPGWIAVRGRPSQISPRASFGLKVAARLRTRTTLS